VKTAGPVVEPEGYLEHTLAQAVLERCDALALFTERPGQIHRTFLSPAMAACHAELRRWMAAAGMRVAIDIAGNVRGHYAAEKPMAPRLIIASHLDTVPHAGRYDGVLGVLLGLALVESLNHKPLSFEIEVIGFSDEEGVRFGFPFIGSRAAIQQLQSEHLQLRDADGHSLADALSAFAESTPEAGSAIFPENSAAYLEFHIEQGPVLDHENLSLAVVESIAGQSRGSVTFLGRAGHAGTTPMDLRRDALMAAAEWLLEVEAIATANPSAVATAGHVDCEPGVANTVPGLVRCTLDVRAPDDKQRRRVFERILAAAENTGIRRHIGVSHRLDYDQPSIRLDESLTALAQQALTQTGNQPRRMVSGAGHDAMVIAPYLRSAMIFLRSPDGISHHPDESVLSGDVAAALHAGREFLKLFPSWLESRQLSCTT